MALPRRTRLPAQVRAQLGRRERVLAASPLAGAEAWALATPGEVVVAGADGVRWRRNWHEVDHGSWDEERSAITITWVDGGRTELALADGARAFPEVFRERVQSSIVHVERLELGTGVMVRAVIRRAADGSLLSQVIADGPVGGSPEESDAVLALETRARRAVGLPD